MKNIGKKIINILKKETKEKFPTTGIIAGQSVAEAYFRIMNIKIHTRIKDIDIFHNEKHVLDKYNNFKKCNKNTSIIRTGVQKIIISESSYGMQTTNNHDKLVILKTVEVEKLNLILVDKLKKTKKSLISSVVDSFDINSIQIGVDLKTKEIYKTKFFDDFVENKQLKIVNYCSPITSLFRLLDKHELSKKELYINKEYETELVLIKSMVQESLSLLKGRGMSRERYYKFSKKTRDYIKKYFKIKKLKIKYNEDRSKNFLLYMFEINKKEIEINLLETLTSFIEKNNTTNYLDSELKSRLNAGLDRSFLEKFKNKNIIKKYNDRATKNKFILDYSFFVKDIHNEKIIDIKTCSKHDKLSLIMISNNKSISEISKQIRRLEKENLHYFIAKIENREEHFDILNLETKVLKKIYQDVLKKSESDYSFSIDKDLSKKDIKIIQLKSTAMLIKVGREMNHCVSGYNFRLQEGESIIFDIIENLKENKRWTVSFKTTFKTNGFFFKIEDLKAKNNKEAPQYIKDLCLEMTKDLKKEFDKKEKFKNLFLDKEKDLFL